MTTDALTFSDIGDSFVPRAANLVARRYGRYGVTREDAAQEMWVWLLGKGTASVRRWLANDPQQTTRIWRSLVDAGETYARAEKAARVGYDPADEFFYDKKLIEAGLILALDTTFDGMVNPGNDSGVRNRKVASEGGNLLAIVGDIRRAIKVCPDWVGFTLLQSEPGGLGWDDAIAALIAVLGGERPTIGRRRVVSNAAAQHMTHAQEAD